MIGRTRWVYPGIFVPMASTGEEPTFTSREQAAVLNAGERDAHVEILIHDAHGDPIGPFRITVRARRLRVVRFNDLIDPLPIPLEAPCAAVITADQPVVVQVTRQDTGASVRAWMGTMAYGSPR